MEVYLGNAHNVEFTVMNIRARANKWDETVTVSWADANGNVKSSVVQTWWTLKQLNSGISGSTKDDWKVKIEDEGIAYVYVKLENTIAGSAKKVKVVLSKIAYCDDTDGSEGTFIQRSSTSKAQLPVRGDL